MSQLPGDTMMDFAELTNVNGELFLVLANEQRVSVSNLFNFLRTQLTSEAQVPQEVTKIEEPIETLPYAAVVALEARSAAYQTTLGGNGVIKLPAISSSNLNKNFVISVDVKQDTVGNRTLSFENVAFWAGQNPISSGDFAKTPNAVSTFYFRVVDGKFIGSYSKYVA